MRDVGPRRTSAFDDATLVVVQDNLQPCPYLPDTIARMPLQWPRRTYLGPDVDAFLEAGYRRSGAFLYRTQCPTCQACEPTRVLVEDFQPRASQRRVLRRGDKSLDVQVVPATVDDRHVELFNLHRNARDLSSDLEDIDQLSYRAFLVDTFCRTVEFQFAYEGQLVAVAVADLGERAMSAVYTYYDPAFSRYSLGTYAILKQLEWCQQRQHEYLYLGLYVAENRHLNYKSGFRLQQRLVDGRWRTVEDDPAAT
ncbi:arginyltransferase [Roseimaritima ulvae]|uniref:Aspartate/glutamate leucyltransferase n=1 Tax=Roseimaritima ulvae TaxID=980254 RepID=A0A5B9QW85_9BACT|nr:arginyltransferase [Roseimaritima ulvae]QEG41645.1 arginyl-tRNA-protein transferase [Roseimaritima ulvae]